MEKKKNKTNSSIDSFSMVLNYLVDKEKENGKSYKDMAKGIEVGENTFKTWRDGKSKPNNGQLDNIAKYFNIPLSILENTDNYIYKDNNGKFDFLDRFYRDIQSMYLFNNQYEIENIIFSSIDEIVKNIYKICHLKGYKIQETEKAHIHNSVVASLDDLLFSLYADFYIFDEEDKNIISKQENLKNLKKQLDQTPNDKELEKKALDLAAEVFELNDMKIKKIYNLAKKDF